MLSLIGGRMTRHPVRLYKYNADQLASATGPSTAAVPSASAELGGSKSTTDACRSAIGNDPDEAEAVTGRSECEIKLVGRRRV